LGALLASGCSGGGATIAPAQPAVPGGGPSPAPSTAPSTAPSSLPTGSVSAGKIKHIVVIIQENRTFDNLFHGFTEPSGAKADYADYGYDKAGNKIALTSEPLEDGATGGDNGHAAWESDYDGGKMDGFTVGNATVSGAPGNYGMTYVPQTEAQPYWDLATQGALAERFFHGLTGATFPSHLVFAAGSSTWNGNPNQRITENPASAGCSNGTGAGNTIGTLNADGSAGPTVSSCLTGVTTIADFLVATHHTWHWYSSAVVPPANNTSVGVAGPAGILNALQAYTQDYFAPDWTGNAISPETRVLLDVPNGTLSDVTWVTPDGVNTDHPAFASSTGPAWVASVVNTIGQSPFWDSTAIFVTWDDWGGFYDHVPPPQKYGVYGPGFRLPCIAISPYAKHGQLIDVQLEPGSILKFIEETFGLSSLGREDATSNSASAMFDFTQSPAPYQSVTAAKTRAYFLKQRPSGLPLDTDMLGPSH
jgi:phospholipase C